MAEALEYTIHVARVGKVLETGNTAAVNAVTLKSLVHDANLPLCYGLHLGCTLRLMETQVAGKAQL